MSSTKISAKNSLVLVNIGEVPTSLVACSDWSLNTNRGTIDVSTIGSDWKEFVPGQISTDGSVNLIYDPSDENVSGAIENAMWNGEELIFHVRPEGTGTGKIDYELETFITSWNITGANEDSIKVAVSFQGSGPIKKTKQA